MTITAVATADHRDPFDINSVPLWAVPQLRRLNRLPNFTVLAFRPNPATAGTSDAWGVVTVGIVGEGRYDGVLRKSDMDTCPHPALLWMGD